MAKKIIRGDKSVTIPSITTDMSDELDIFTTIDGQCYIKVDGKLKRINNLIESVDGLKAGTSLNVNTKREVTKAQYNAIANPTAGLLYFITDTNEIYYNGKRYSKNIQTVNGNVIEDSETGIVTLIELTMAEYDALQTIIPNIVYAIKDEGIFYVNDVEYGSSAEITGVVKKVNNQLPDVNGFVTVIKNITLTDYKSLSPATKANGMLYTIVEDKYRMIAFNGVACGTIPHIIPTMAEYEALPVKEWDVPYCITDANQLIVNERKFGAVPTTITKSAFDTTTKHNHKLYAISDTGQIYLNGVYFNCNEIITMTNSQYNIAYSTGAIHPTKLYLITDHGMLKCNNIEYGYPIKVLNTQAEYDDLYNASKVVQRLIYFIKDTKNIYIGLTKFGGETEKSFIEVSSLDKDYDFDALSMAMNMKINLKTAQISGSTFTIVDETDIYVNKTCTVAISAEIRTENVPGNNQAMKLSGVAGSSYTIFPGQLFNYYDGTYRIPTTMVRLKAEENSYVSLSFTSPDNNKILKASKVMVQEM